MKPCRVRLDFTRSYFSALKTDRQAFYLSDMWRTIGLIFTAIAAVFMYAKQWIKPWALYAIIIIFSTIDLVGVSKRYLKEDGFVEPADLEAPYADTRADVQLKERYQLLSHTEPGSCHRQWLYSRYRKCIQ